MGSKRKTRMGSSMRMMMRSLMGSHLKKAKMKGC